MTITNSIGKCSHYGFVNDMCVAFVIEMVPKLSIKNHKPYQIHKRKKLREKKHILKLHLVDSVGKNTPYSMAFICSKSNDLHKFNGKSFILNYMVVGNTA